MTDRIAELKRQVRRGDFSGAPELVTRLEAIERELAYFKDKFSQVGLMNAALMQREADRLRKEYIASLVSA